jgi:hypothetical protein
MRLASIVLGEVGALHLAQKLRLLEESASVVQGAHGVGRSGEQGFVNHNLNGYLKDEWLEKLNNKRVFFM